MRRERARASVAVGILLIAGLALSGCTTVDPGEKETATSEQAESAVPDVMVGELSGYDGNLKVGDDITVLVNLPADEWEVTGSDPAVVEIVQDQRSEDAAIVRLVASAPGESTVVFTNTDGESDELTVVVSES